MYEFTNVPESDVQYHQFHITKLINSKTVKIDDGKTIIEFKRQSIEQVIFVDINNKGTIIFIDHSETYFIYWNGGHWEKRLFPGYVYLYSDTNGIYFWQRQTYRDINKPLVYWDGKIVREFSTLKINDSCSIQYRGGVHQVNPYQW